MKRCVIDGGADINNYEYIKSCLRNDDFIVFCDSGLKHLESLQVNPGLIVGDFDSHDNPHLGVETIVLPCEKDDTDTVFAVKEAIKRGVVHISLFLLHIRERTLKPIFILLNGNLFIGAFVAFGHRFVLPFFEIRFFDLTGANTGGVTLIVFLIQRNGGIVRHFLFVVFLSGYVLTVAGFAFCDSVAVVGIIVALHNEILAAAFALPDV